MENIEKIKSLELRQDILGIKKEILESKINNLGNLKRHIWSKYIMGCDGPICISDVEIVGDLNSFDVYLGVDYKIMYCYKPYQDLDDVIVLRFKVDKLSRRDNRLSELL